LFRKYSKSGTVFVLLILSGFSVSRLGAGTDGATYDRKHAKVYVHPGSRLKTANVKGYQRHSGHYTGPYKSKTSSRKVRKKKTPSPAPSSLPSNPSVKN